MPLWGWINVNLVVMDMATLGDLTHLGYDAHWEEHLWKCGVLHFGQKDTIKV